MPLIRHMSKNASIHDLSNDALELLAARFRVLGEASRLKLLQALQPGEKSVSDLLLATGLTQANASRHLQTLTQAGIVARRKEGLKVIYSIADRGIFNLCEHVCGSVKRRLTQNAEVIA